MNFSDELKERTLNSLARAESERIKAAAKSAAAYSDELLELVKASCIDAAEAGERHISGYVAKKWHQSNYSLVITEFPDDNIVFKSHGKNEFYMMRDFGTDENVVSRICSRLTESLKKIGLNSFKVTPTLKTFTRREMYIRWCSKRPRFRVIRQTEKYVVHIDITW